MSKQEKAEWIPAHLEYNGKAKVEEYFDSRIKQVDDNKFIGFFRGHELVGKELEIPEGYEACLVSKKDKKLEKISDISQIRVWELDTPTLDMTLKFTDVLTIGRILAED